MNNLDKNWNSLFGEYTADETAWHGQWTVYSPNQEVIKSQQAVRSFRSNLDNTVITHINRYLDADGNVVDEKTWQIERETCNQPDGVVHPAMPSMRALSFGAGATAWISQKLIPGKPFGVELFFRDHNWRTSVAIVYGENGQLNRIVNIREHLGRFSDELPSLGTPEISGNWIGNKRSMTSDLSVSPEEEIQISFEQLSGDSVSEATPKELALLRSPYSPSGILRQALALALAKRDEVQRDEVQRDEVQRDEVQRDEVQRDEVQRDEVQRGEAQASADRKMISLPGGMILMLPEMVRVDQPIQLAAGQRTADHQLKYLTALYTAVGQFTLLISATLQQQI